MKISIPYFFKTNSVQKTPQPKKIKDVILLIEKGYNAKSCIEMYLNTKQKKIKPNGNKLDKVNEKLNKLFEKLSEKLVSSKNKIHQERYRKAIETIDELMKSFIEKSTKEMFDFMDMAYEPMINF